MDKDSAHVVPSSGNEQCVEGDQLVELPTPISSQNPEPLHPAQANAFRDFLRKVTKLQKALFNFTNAAKQLRGSVGTMSCANPVAKSLSNLLDILHENIGHLCPKTIMSRSHEAKAPGTADEELDIAFLKDQMRELANNVNLLLTNLTILSQFEDQEIQQDFQAFSDDLQYWASCLQLYHDRFEEMAVRRYVNDMTTEIAKHIDSIEESLSYFTEIAVPMVAIAQHHDPANIQNLTTVATFFSAVTATTLQFSYNSPHDPKSNLVNGFWFTSLVFSVASTVNLLLGALLMRVLYRTPVRVPRLIYLWLYGSPLVFLVVAVACFSVALAVFAYSSNQHRSVSTITTAFSAFTYTGVGIVLVWFIIARSKYHRKRVNPRPSRGIREFIIQPVQTTSGEINQPPAPRGFISPFNGIYTPDMEAGQPAHDHQIRGDPTSPHGVEKRRLGIVAALNMATVIAMWARRAQAHQLPPERREPFRRIARVTKRQIIDPDPRLNEADARHLPGTFPTEDRGSGKTGVRHLSFSPDGKLLAICGGEILSTIWHVRGPVGGEGLKLSCRLHHSGGLADEVVWSPDGRLLITKLKSDIIIWSNDGRLHKKLNRGHRVKSVVWLPKSEAFLSLEGSKVLKMDTQGSTLATYSFEGVALRSIDVSPQVGSPWMVCAGVLLSPLHGNKPSDEKFAHRCLIVYDMFHEKIQVQVPLLHDVRDVTIADNGRLVLVTFKDKMQPQLWKLVVRDTNVQLLLSAIYPCETAGLFRLSCFGGANDQFVICTSKDGYISIFHRGTGETHNTVTWDVAEDDDRRCIAWNRSAKGSTMFATGSGDEGVQLWNASPPDTAAKPVNASSQSLAAVVPPPFRESTWIASSTNVSPTRV